ncbi:MAG: ureidoglycolate lyase [Vicinamibacterales bacterium]
MRVTVEPPDPAAFAPFGAFIDAPHLAGERRFYSDWLRPAPGLSLQFHTNRVAASTLPLTVDRVEHHPHTAQAFVPLRVARYLVTVMASDGRGRPDPASARAFLVPTAIGVVYRAGTWHANMTVLDEVGSFAVLMWRGAADDDVVVPIEPIVVSASADDARGGGA